jgi:anti-anti-sigma factor
MDDGTSAARRKLSIAGEMTIYRAAELRAEVQAALAQGSGDLDIDLAAVTEMDSSGVQLLMAADKSALAGGFALRLVDHSAAVMEVLETLGLDGHPGDLLQASSEVAAP